MTAEDEELKGFSHKHELFIKKGVIPVGTEEDGAIQKGQLFSWDVVLPCKPDTCRIVEVCPYSKKGRCMVEHNFMKEVTGLYYRIAETHYDEMLMLNIGVHLIPLYQTLIQMLKHELYVRHSGKAEIEDDKGQIRIHPVYKEIREINKNISQFMIQSGLKEFMSALGFMNPLKLPKSAGGSDTGDNKTGDPGVAERMRDDDAQF